MSNLPPQNMRLSILCTTVTWTHHDYPGMSNLSPTNHASEYPMYHSYLDTPGLSRDVQLVRHKPRVWVSRVSLLPGHTGDYPRMSNLPPTNHVSEYPLYHSYLDTPGMSNLPPHKLCAWVSRVPQLPGHTGTIPGCPHLPPTNHVSEYPMYHSY